MAMTIVNNPVPDGVTQRNRKAVCTFQMVVDARANEFLAPEKVLRQLDGFGIVFRAFINAAQNTCNLCECIIQSPSRCYIALNHKVAALLECHLDAIVKKSVWACR